jgi:hypothetical protein
MEPDYDLLQQAIQQMTPRTKPYQLLKQELSQQGYWRNHPRGNPKKAYRQMIKKQKEEQQEQWKK